jgi:hypothetical protein
MTRQLGRTQRRIFLFKACVKDVSGNGANGGFVFIVHEIESMIGAVFWVRTKYRDIEKIILSDIPSDQPLMTQH